MCTVTDPTAPAVTRIPEFKPLTGQTHTGTSYVRKEPTAEAEAHLIGRLSPYRHHSIDPVAAEALA